MTEQKKMTIDGVDYNVAELSDEARAQIVALRHCDQKLRELRRELAIVQTARGAYAGSLKQSLARHGSDQTQ